MDKKIGLVLSGGGINGIAHLELLKNLEKNGVTPIAMTGSSAGAIIAALYADGGTNRVIDFFDALDKSKIFYRRSLLTRGFGVAFRKLEELIRDTLVAKDFASLSLPFACTATDLLSGETIILKSGDLVTALMASSSAPGFFTPRLIGDKFLADGGITQILPVQAVRDLGAEFVIGSILNDFEELTLEKAQGLSRIGNLNRAVEIIRHHYHKDQIASCDFCFDFPISDIPGYSFHSKDISVRRAQECLDIQTPLLLQKLTS